MTDGSVAWVREGPGGKLCVDRGGVPSHPLCLMELLPSVGYRQGLDHTDCMCVAGLGERGAAMLHRLCWSSGRGNPSPRAWLCSESFARIPGIFPAVVRGGSVTTSTSQMRTRGTERSINLPKVTQVRRNGVRICTQDIKPKHSGTEGGRNGDRGQQKGRWPEKKNWGEEYFTERCL